MSNETQATLKGLNYRIRAIKGSLTKFNNFLDNLAENFSTIEINTRLCKIKELWSQYFDIQMQIESIQEGEISDLTSDTFEDDYFRTITRAESLLAPRSKTSCNSIIDSNQTQDIKSNIRLPQISLPSFSGSFEEWLPFYETFKSLIHTNESLSNVQKFHYLKSCLKNDAINCIQELHISSDNYDIAWKTLRDRFDNKRLIIKKHIHAIHELPHAMHENSNILRQILDGVQKHTRALKVLDRPVDQWGDWLIYLVTSKIDRFTNKEWEASIKSDAIPEFHDLIDFLSHKCNTLESISRSNVNALSHSKLNKQQKVLAHVTRQEVHCPVCKDNHFINQCKRFLNMSLEERVNSVKTAKLCLNCFRMGHQAKFCKSSYCKKCSHKHNTLLHRERANVSVEINATESPEVDPTPGSSMTLSAQNSNLYVSEQVLLSTAIVKIADRDNSFHSCRVLLDSASQSNFISSALAKKLQLQEMSVDIPISGISQISTRIKTSVSAFIKSSYSEFSTSLKCLVINNITNNVPSVAFERADINLPKNIRLGDPEFNRPRKIDMLIGAEVFWQLVCIGQIKLQGSNLVAQKTQLGWTISGSVNNGLLPPGGNCNLAIETSVESRLAKFWEIEEVNHSNDYTAEERTCENHFLKNYARNETGRFVVKLPLKTNPAVAVVNLRDLAIEEGEEYPVGADVIHTSFYVDDMLAGSDSSSGVRTIFREVNALLKKGGFELRKWACSDPNLLSELLPNATEPTVLNLEKDGTIKTLGLQWNSELDTLQYNLPDSNSEKRITKRSILSHIAQIFDPLGLIGPVIVIAKILMQTLWQLRVSWDETLPLHIHTEWLEYKNSLSHLSQLRIYRNVMPHKDEVELHGFCDASERAYGACIFIRTANVRGEVDCGLLCSKSRVAPLKSTSIPRLELCAALLLSQLMNKAMQALSTRVSRVRYWTDSTITIAWINTTSRKLKTFVANRVAEIQDTTDASSWYHIGTHENPADILSRGALPQTLLHCDLWWRGPAWLSAQDSSWPRSNIHLETVEIPETRNLSLINTVVTHKFDFWHRYSKLLRLQRVTCYCMRFIYNLRCRVKHSRELINIGPLTTVELNATMNVLIKAVQTDAFPEEIRDLQGNRTVKSESKLRGLNPFTDSDGIIRVGGRLLQAQCKFNEKHQIILPSTHPFTNLLIEQTHRSELHAGVQATLAKVRSKYWPLSGRSTVRRVIRSCVTCFKANPIPVQPIMGNLPAARVEPARPFLNVGVDYCGPFMIRSSLKRKAPTYKAYVAIFICMAVKAVHIELVTSMDSNAFINALKRFIARRGMVSNIYSDNGTNFVKANKELKELHKMFLTGAEVDKITNALSSQGISWHFNPPRGPNFGGLWEAAVKSFKRHFKRIVGGTLLTYEEFYTVSAQIEAVLNSRPMLPLSEDPTDLSILTPGHFLIGESLRCNLEPNLTQLPLNHISRFQHLEQLKQHFWKRWSTEYLQQLQQRMKWTKAIGSPLKEGQLVILREDNVPPMSWPLGRIVAVHPGADGIVRVATVKTSRGEVKRPANKLCVLPNEP